MAGLMMALATWDGFVALTDSLSNDGLRLPIRYREEILRSADCRSIDEVERYWAEYAREYVRAAGQVIIESRSFAIPTVYRSSYLDKLASDCSERGDTVSSPPFLPLLPCLRKLERRRQRDPTLALEFTSLMSQKKKADANFYPELAVHWDGTKLSQSKILTEIANRRGHLVKYGVASIRKPNGLQLSMKLDAKGGRPEAVGIQIDHDLSFEDNPNVRFRISWHKICPGFHHYNIFDEPSAVVLGIQANVVIAEKFLSTL